MNRFAILAVTAAAATVLAGCSDFKATDKILRNDHRVIQKTRVVQQPAIVRVQQPTVRTVQVQQPQVVTTRAVPQTVVARPVITTARTRNHRGAARDSVAATDTRTSH